MLQRVILFLTVFLVTSVARSADSLTVSAGESTRTNVPVSFQLPDGTQGAMHLVSDQNKEIPIYISGHQATFILDNLPANQSATYKLQPGEAKSEKINLTRENNVLKISAGDKPILTYQGDPSTPPDGIEAV